MSPQTIDAVRALEVDLLGREDVYLQILDSLADMVLVKGAHSRLLWANKAFREYYAMDLEQLRELVDAPFNAPDHTQQYVADDLRVFTTGETLDIPMEVVTRHDGVEGLFHTVKSAIRDEQGRVRLTVGVSRNIGETVHLREELLRNRDQLSATGSPSSRRSCRASCFSFARCHRRGASASSAPASTTTTA